MPLSRVLVLVVVAVASAVQAQSFDAPNVVAISPQLVTSGQPSPAALRTLGSQGFQTVIYLAPWTVPDAVKDEPQILASQGVEFRHIPIPFGGPEESHVKAVSETLTSLRGKKVLVHCQVNMRASSMVFLHRVVAERQDPAKAYESVAAVWSPEGPWRALIKEQLKKAGIDFQPY